MKPKKWSPMDSLNHNLFFAHEQQLIKFDGLLYISNQICLIKKLYQLLLYQFFLFLMDFFFLSYSLSVPSHKTSERRLYLYIFSWILLVVFSNSSTVRLLKSTNKIKQFKGKKKKKNLSCSLSAAKFEKVMKLKKKNSN